jgi:hypothetical protein
MQEVDIMSKEIQIQLNLGDGLLTRPDNDKLAVLYEPNGNMLLDPVTTPGTGGMFVNDLNGANGSGGTHYDGYTVKPGRGTNINNPSDTISDFVDIDRSVVNMIFTLGLYRPASRNPSNITYSSTVKDVKSICNEIVAPVWYSPQSYTSYKPKAGELIQLVTNPTFRTVPSGGVTKAVESIDRVANNNAQVTQAMFVITEIHYMSDIQQGGNQYWVHDMKLCCIYSGVADYTVGTTYSGTQGFDSNYI